MDQRGDGGVPRRRFLEALAIAPAAAAAGCAGAGADRRAPDGDPAPAAAGPTSGSRPPAGAVAAIRAFAVPPEADPAFVFRAAAARPGDPR
jgi:hypothetical protein